MITRLILVLRLVLAAIFIYAAITKLRQPWLVFAMSIDAYQLLPEWGVLFTARTVPWFELIIGALLIPGWWLRFTSVGAAVLLTVFFSIMALSFRKGMGIDCGCFGLGEALTWKSLLRDGLLLGSSLLLCWLAFRGSRDQRKMPAA